MRRLLRTIAAVAAAIGLAYADMDSADADYCIGWGNGKDIFNTHLLFVRKYNDLKTFKVPRNRLTRSTCTGYSYGFSPTFIFIDKSGREVFFFHGGFYVGAGGGVTIKRTTTLAIDSGGVSNCVSSTTPVIISAEELEELVKISFADSASLWESTIKHVKKKDFLRFKGKIINGHVDVSIGCEPDLDTTYSIDFRIRVIGECKNDFLKERERKRQSKEAAYE